MWMSTKSTRLAISYDKQQNKNVVQESLNPLEMLFYMCEINLNIHKRAIGINH